MTRCDCAHARAHARGCIGYGRACCSFARAHAAVHGRAGSRSYRVGAAVRYSSLAGVVQGLAVR